jgi:hypothetical protein
MNLIEGKLELKYNFISGATNNVIQIETLSTNDNYSKK